MPSRVVPFVNGEIYHIYNRGVNKIPIFGSRRNFQRFLNTLVYYQFEGPKPKFSNSFRIKTTLKRDKIVEILCYSLMPNHFHLMIKQLKEGGITEFLSKLSNSYTKYYNIKYDRVGPLLQGEFKAVLVESDEQLIHLSRYIHLNPLVAHLTKSLAEYQWSSYHEYTNGIQGICNKEPVKSFFKSPEGYKHFIMDYVDYAEKLELLKHQTLE
jgi:putative transposase